eukprot:10946894-Alexandrium_andersonii.AAC.1
MRQAQRAAAAKADNWMDVDAGEEEAGVNNKVPDSQIKAYKGALASLRDQAGTAEAVASIEEKLAEAEGKKASLRPPEIRLQGAA